MSNSRRQFLNRASLALAASAAACRRAAQNIAAPSTGATPGAPPAFGTAPPVGPPVSSGTFTEAEKLVQFELTPAARQMAAGNWRKQMAPVYERRAGPRKFAPDSSFAPASRWDPVLPGQPSGLPARDRFVRSKPPAAALPAADSDRSEER